MNPGVAQANITRSVNGTRYHSLQVELRRRLSHGLMVSGNYTFANKTQSAFTFLPAAARSVRMDPVFLSSTDIPHSFKANWLWELPFGRGRRFGASTGGLVNALLGDWDFSGIARFQMRQFSTHEGPARRHDARRAAGRVRDSHGAVRGRRHHRLELPAGHRRQHPAGVQHRSDVGDRLRRRRAADRPVHRAAQQPRVPVGLRRRLRAAADQAARPAVLARRHADQEAVPVREEGVRRSSTSRCRTCSTRRTSITRSI